MTTIRPATPADHAAALAVNNAVFPDHAETLEDDQQFLCQLVEHPLGPHVQDWVAEVGGEVVGTARLWQAPWMFHPERYHLELAVLPEFRGRGVGSSLFDTAQGHWQGRGAREVLAGAKETETQALAMLERRGFREVMRFFDNVLRLEDVNYPALQAYFHPPAGLGLEVMSLSELEHKLGEQAAWQAYYDCHREARLDVPRTAPASETSFEEFRKYRDQPKFLTDGVFLAVTDTNEVVAMSELWRDSTSRSRLRIGLTGTRRAWRRRGLARVLKANGIFYASFTEAEELWTNNASNNAPMLALNDALGFVRQPAHVECQWGKV